MTDIIGGVVQVKSLIIKKKKFKQTAARREGSKSWITSNI